MTRRSFCFLFGAGVAGLALAPAETAREQVARLLNVPLRMLADPTTKIVDAIGMPTIATFRTRDRLALGRSIAIEFQGQTLFAGNVVRTMTDADGIEITAVDTAAFHDQRPPRVGPLSPLIDAGIIGSRP